MADANGPVRVAGLGDIHVTETQEHPFRDLFKEISERADVLALCGDLTNLGKPSEAAILAKDLEALSIPAVAVLGNHDHECGDPDQVVHILREAGVLFLEDQVHEAAGVGFAGVKGFAGGFAARMLSPFGEQAMKTFVGETVNESLRLENALRGLGSRVRRKVVVLHYAPVVDTVAGEPEQIYPFLGSSRLGEVIDRFEVNLVLHGHAHRGAYQGATPKGIPVYNCAAMIEKPSGRPYALIEV